MGNFAAEMDKWTKKARRNIELVTKDSAQDIFELMTIRQPSVKETGGTFVQGRVPVDTSELINSFESSLNGTVVGTGDASHKLAIAAMTAGDSVEGVFTAPHGPAMEYGTDHTAGRFFVRNAVAKWDQIVEANAARYK